MQKILSSQKFLIAMVGLSLVATTSLSLLNNNFAAKNSAAKDINSGLGICFQRVSQTFTALMIGDLSSNFLTKSFKNTTGDCFKEVSKSMNKDLGADKEMQKLSNNFASDLHWFHNKIGRVVKMAKGSNLNLSQSNINSKFDSLEGIRNKMEEGLSQAAFNSVQNKDMGLMGVFGAQAILLLSLVGLFMKGRGRRSEADAIEKALNDDKELMVDVLIEKMGTIFNIPKTQKTLKRHFDALTQDKMRLEANLIQLSTEGETRYKVEAEAGESLTVKSSVNFQETLNNVLNGLKGKIFSSGVVFDTNLSDDFSVYSKNEELEQFLYYTLNFAIDAASEVSKNPKVILDSKPLGGISYCKLKIQGYNFSDEDLKVINGHGLSETKNVNMNLVLLKELLSDANASMAVRNKQSQELDQIESEIEIVFERVQERKEELQSKVVRGTKKEIQQILQRNL